MPRLWKYWQLSNCHRHALRKWLLVLKRANLAGLPHRRYACVMRPLRYSINVTLDGCCDHRAIPADEDLHRHAIENLDQADALLFGRVIYEMMEAAWRPPAPAGARPEWMELFARTIDAAKKYVVSRTLDRVDWNADLGLCAWFWPNLPDFNTFMHWRWVSQLREQAGLCLGREVR